MVLSERLLPRRIYIDIIEIIVDADGPYIKSCSFSFFLYILLPVMGIKIFLYTSITHVAASNLVIDNVTN